MRLPWRRLTMLAALVCASYIIPARTQPAVRPNLVFEGMMVQGGLVYGRAPAGIKSLTLDEKPVLLADDGRFLIGLDRDQPGEALLAAQFADGTEWRERLRIAPGHWKIENINVARRPSAATAEYLRIREGELARIQAARSVRAAGEGWRQRFVWPAGGRISGLFGSQRIYRGERAAFHSGVDIAARAGAPVVAPADGIVVLAGPPMLSLEGNLVIIDHGMGLNSAFLHLSTTRVREGQTVRQGETIGTVGATGRATGPHLHWSMKWLEARIDPRPLANPPR